MTEWTPEEDEAFNMVEKQQPWQTDIESKQI